MDWLFDPNIAYLLVVSGVMMAIVTIIIPGTGIPEFLMVLFLIGAWYGMQGLQTNTLALVVVGLSLIPFFLAIKQQQYRLVWLVLSILMLTAGSIFLFTDASGKPMVSFMLAGVVSLTCAIFLWVAITRGIQVSNAKVILDPDSPVGKIGSARSEIHNSGSVYVNGELWSARSDEVIPSGNHVRVLRREGFTLTVKAIDKK